MKFILGAVLLALLLSFGLAEAIVQIPGVLPACQTAWNAHFTGPSVAHGHHVQCFDGQIISVGKVAQ